MNRLRRFIPVLGLVALLIGCGGGSEQGPLKIFLWEQMDPKEQALLAEHIAFWEAANPGIVVEQVHYETEQLRTQFQNAALAGAGPQLVYGPSDQVGPFSIMGIIEPLDGIFSVAELDSFGAESLIRMATPGEADARLWSLPDQLGNHLTLCMNRAFVPQTPASFEQLIEIAKANTIDENGDGRPERYGLVFNQREPFWLVPFLGAFGGWVMDAAGNPTLGTPAMVGALTFLRDLKTVHGIVPIECDYDMANALFNEGKAAFLINGPWSWQGYIDSGVDLALAPMPLIGATGRYPIPMVSAKGYSLSANARGRQREEALRLMRFLTGEFVQERLGTGLGVIPSRLLAGEKAASGHPLIAPSRAQILRGRAMPVVPEMRAIWDVARPELQAVLGGAKSPEEAASAMQSQAIKKIAEMKGQS